MAAAKPAPPIPPVDPRVISPLLFNGLKFLEAGDATGADLLLQTYLGGAPDDADGHNLAGLAKRELGDREGALTHLERAVALAPAEATYAVNLATMLADTGEHARALETVQRVLTLVPGQPQALLTYVQILQRLGRLAEAVTAARLATTFHPTLAQAHYNLGLALFRSGQSAAAVAAFLEATACDPQFADAWINAGVAQKDCGDLTAAEASYRRALVLAPRDATIYNNLGNVLTTAKRPDEAVDAFRTALTLNPDYVDAKANLAMVLRDAGDIEEAIALLAAANAAHPNHVSLLNTYGNTLRQAERYDEAIEILRQAIALDERHAEAHNNLGLAYALKHRMDDAVHHLGRAAALRPESSVISNNYGALLLRLFRFEECIAALENAIARDPNYDDALVNLGIAHYMLGHADQAIAAYKRVIARNPDSSFAHYSLGVSYLEDQRLAEAEVEITRALELDPKNALARNTLGVLLLDQHRVADACAAMRAAADVNTSSAPTFYSNYAFASLYDPALSNSQILEIHKEFGRRYATADVDRTKPHRNDRSPDRKLRLAYLSSDFRAHSVAYFFESLLEKHDRSQFEILLYSDTTRKDAVTDAMRAGADRWVETGGLVTDVFARQLVTDKIDILVNLGGHTSGNRLPACAVKPAPVQIEYLGYPETSGVPAMQYRISDQQADPAGVAEPWCTEELVRMPHCFHCYRPHGRAPDVAPPPFLVNGFITYTSFNVLPKVTDRVIAVWAEILRAVPNARFLLKCKQLRDVRIQQLIRDKFADEGVDPGRIDMTAFVPSIQAHLNTYAKADLGLDPFPYNGTTTTCEAMWMGVPVLTIRGDNHRGRVGYSLLHAVGLDHDFVVDGVEAYVSRAIALGRDPSPLIAVRSGLRARMAASPLCDEVGFTKELEATYRRLWRRWCTGPETFMLKPPPELRADDSIQGVLVKTL
ncbi:MAG: tetratricopeptide repeat protein [Rhodospirillaceae bacterium]|nr:MAG: tetratricopeptide repeat protein [Rhodospirillaceae bacterium]